MCAANSRSFVLETQYFTSLAPALISTLGLHASHIENPEREPTAIAVVKNSLFYDSQRLSLLASEAGYDFAFDPHTHRNINSGCPSPMECSSRLAPSVEYLAMIKQYRATVVFPNAAAHLVFYELFAMGMPVLVPSLDMWLGLCAVDRKMGVMRSGMGEDEMDNITPGESHVKSHVKSDSYTCTFLVGNWAQRMGGCLPQNSEHRLQTLQVQATMPSPSVWTCDEDQLKALRSPRARLAARRRDR